MNHPQQPHQPTGQYQGPYSPPPAGDSKPTGKVGDILYYVGAGLIALLGIITAILNLRFASTLGLNLYQGPLTSMIQSGFLGVLIVLVLVPAAGAVLRLTGGKPGSPKERQILGMTFRQISTAIAGGLIIHAFVSIIRGVGEMFSYWGFGAAFLISPILSLLFAALMLLGAILSLPRTSKTVTATQATHSPVPHQSSDSSVLSPQQPQPEQGQSTLAYDEDPQEQGQGEQILSRREARERQPESHQPTESTAGTPQFNAPTQGGVEEHPQPAETVPVGEALSSLDAVAETNTEPEETALEETRQGEVQEESQPEPTQPEPTQSEPKPEPVQPEATQPEPTQPVVAPQPFWFAVATPRRTVEEPGSVAFDLVPGEWILAREDRGTEFVVQSAQGQIGILRDLTGIERAAQ